MSVISNRARNLFDIRHSLCKHQFRRILNLWAGFRPNEWSRAVSEAEKIVGYPTSFMSLRLLLSDEISNVAMNMRKLVGTKHPLLKTARGFLSDEKNGMQTRGLIVLLISKAAGPSQSEAMHDEMVSGIYPSQRSLAEITEMIHTASLIHKGVLNLDDLHLGENSLSDLEFGNKLAILCGDFLLANASTGLAKLNNTQVVSLIASAIRDMMTAEFTVLKDDDGNSLLPPDGAAVSDWQKSTYLSSGSLISKSCQAAMVLAHKSDQVQQMASAFGENMAYTKQLCEDLQPLMNSKDNGEKLNLASVPCMLFRQHKPSHGLLDEYSQNPTAQNKRKLYREIKENSTIIKDALQMRNSFAKKAQDALSCFAASDSKGALCNIINALERS